ncbi:MAG: hypothetical protein ACQXXH_02055 [Candidatus Bathyarchaeia archaeon]|nr:hypothetical protein [Candidatus Bathyarchaeota archaeon A05DMB-4]MDH7594528.1 hypothetical protein [Candidatus Bathyarchaeota archaeon]
MKMFVWCNRQHEVIEIIVDKFEEYDAVMKEVSKLSGVLEVSTDHQKFT